MKMKLLLILIILLPNICNSKQITHRYELSIVIKDFLLMLDQSLMVSTSALCWRKDEFYYLTRTLIDNGFLTTPSRGNLSTYWPHEQQLFLVDMSCENSNAILMLANKEDTLDFPSKWLLIENPSKPNLPITLNIFIRSRLYIIQKFNSSYKIISKYRLAPSTHSYHTNDITTWTNNNFIYYNKLTDSKNRTNLMKLVVNASIVIVNPDTINKLLDTRDKHIEPVNKVNYPLVLNIMEAINATPHLLIRNTWGYQIPNSTKFTGMIRDAQDKVAEICVTPCFLTKNRLNIIEVAGTVTLTEVRFVFRAPPLSYIQNIYTLPFHTKVWLACFGLVTISPIIFFIITFWEIKENNDLENDSKQLKPNFKDLLHLQVSSMCQQGCEMEPSSTAGRIAIIFLLISTLFLYTSYSANIVTLLQSTSDSIKTLENLYNSRIELGIEETPYNRYYAGIQDGEFQKKIFNERLCPPGKPDAFMDIHNGTKKIRNQYFALHAETTAIYKVMSDTFEEYEKCGLMEIQFALFNEPYAVVRKNSTYTEIIRVAFRKMKERGIVYWAFNRIYIKKPQCLNQGGNFLSVSLVDAYAAFLIFGIGIAITMVVFIIEKIVHHQQIIKFTTKMIKQTEKKITIVLTGK